ncbi:hypothetical protein PVAP13_8KG027800 [Panicum virgatum]|uniref:Uncharacterized protein n=1 Tax=Panicum virgatum TaxID=38727 RepID=A0A8T0PD58_PANVG|nr:hypothetical protein PVAP13_8KG027800 [Panicum virgatum]
MSYLADWWTTSRKRVAKADRMCFDSIVILTSWMIWNERNRRTFDSKIKTVPELLACLEEEALSWPKFRVVLGLPGLSIGSATDYYSLRSKM